MKELYINPWKEDGELEDITQELASTDTTRSVARGSAASTTYLLEPRIWFRDLIDGAKKSLIYSQFAHQKDVPKGYKDAVFVKRKQYLPTEVSAVWQASVTPGSSVSFTDMNNMDGVEVIPGQYNYGVAISYDVIQTNAIDYVSEAKNELMYHAGDEVDQFVVSGIVSSGSRATSAAAGSYTIYGGDANQASELASGDVITTDMVAKAARKLKSKIVEQWTLGTGETAVATTTAVANPWMNEGDFVLCVAPEQEEVFLTDSQFVNAAEYGSDAIVKNGEIGRYLGVPIIVSNNTKMYAASSSNRDGSSNTSISTNTCVMQKSKKAIGLAYGKRPTMHVVDYPRELEIDLILEQSYGTGTIHGDAKVWLDLAQS